MTTLRLLAALAALALSLAACRDNKVQSVPPTLALEALALEFGPVRVGSARELTLAATAANGADVLLGGLAVDGAPAFTVLSGPERIPGRSTETIVVRYAPTVEGDDAATLVVRSNDERQPEVQVALSGRGAHPALALEVACDAATRCEATVNTAPPSVQFAAEPIVRQRPLSVGELPRLVLHSRGEVPLTLTGLTLTGADAPAFSFVGNATLGDGGTVLAPDASVALPLRFRPTSALQQTYAAQVELHTDDPRHAATTIPLTGALRPNLPPTACINVARVVPADGRPPLDFDSPAGWAEALRADGGVDYTATRDIAPRAEVQLSALADAADETACSADPEDGRLGLTWQWALVAQPAGSSPVTLLNATTPRAVLRPSATGRYEVSLTVTDNQGNATTATAAFSVAVKNDLVVQLEWQGAAGVDLDLHLVRPTDALSGQPFAGAFSPFAADAGGTAGDINGYAVSARPDGGRFDWGAPGPLDDPQLNVDDTGDGPLVENVSLNQPGNDPACASGPCRYRVLVHGFRDARPTSGATPCVVDGGVGCQDGDACDCAAPARCVAAAAPAGQPALGPGRCLPPAAPVVRVFVQGSSSPAAVIPLAPATLTVGAPCQLLAVADVVWPAAGADAGVLVTPLTEVARFGFRAAGSLQCAPDGPQGGVPWYSLQPR